MKIKFPLFLKFFLGYLFFGVAGFIAVATLVWMFWGPSLVARYVALFAR